MFDHFQFAQSLATFVLNFFSFFFIKGVFDWEIWI